MKTKSILKTLLTPLLTGVTLLLVLYSTYNYYEVKNAFDMQLEEEIELSTTQLKNTLPHFIDSYSMNEYQKIIEKQMVSHSISAIIVKDYNYGKIFGKEFIKNGKIKLEKSNIRDYSEENPSHKIFLDTLHIRSVELFNDKKEKIADLYIYTNDEPIHEAAAKLIEKTFFEIIFLILAITIITYVIIKISLVKQLNLISQSIQNTNEDGTPKNPIELSNINELNELIEKMNLMIGTIKTSKANITNINKRFELTLSSINDGIWDWNLVTNKVYFSTLWKKMLGFESEELFDKPEVFFDLVHPDFKELVQISFNKHLEDPEKYPYNLEIKVRTKQNNYIWIQTRGKVILDENGTPIRMLGVHTNIETKKNLESQISSQKEKYETIQNSANAIIATISLDGIMNYINKYGEEFTGYTKEKIASKPYFWFEKFIPEEIKPTINLTTETLIEEITKNKNSINTKQNEWINKTGERRMIEWSLSLINDENNNPLYITAIGIDVTEQETLKHIKTLYNVIDETQSLAKIATISQNASTDEYSVSDEFYNIWELPKENKITKETLLSTIDTDDLERVLNLFKEIKNCEEAREEAHTIIFKIKTPLENEKYIEAHISKFSEYKYEFNGIIQDITSKVLSEQKEKEQHAILIQQSRLALLGEMVSMIAHQWRQPLNNISVWKGNLIMSIKENPNDIQTVDLINEKINESIIYLSRTIDDFRDFYKTNKQISDFSVKELLEKTLILVESQLTKNNINLIINTDYDIKIRNYENELIQVIMSIINNAIDAMQENENRILELNLTQKDKKVIIEIIDNGCGIDSKIQDKIFEPYFSTKDEKNGTGIGLYMAKMIVEKSLQGQLNFASKEDKTSFKIELNI